MNFQSENSGIRLGQFQKPKPATGQCTFIPLSQQLIPTEWAGDKRNSGMKKKARVARQASELTLIEVPFLPATTRIGHLDAQQGLALERLTKIRLHSSDPPATFLQQLIVEVGSNNMAPRLCKGDWLRCQYIPTAEWSFLPSGVYAICFANHFVIKRLKMNDLRSKGILTVYSEDTAVGVLSVPQEQLQQIWHIVEIISGSIQ